LGLVPHGASSELVFLQFSLHTPVGRYKASLDSFFPFHCFSSCITYIPSILREGQQDEFLTKFNFINFSKITAFIYISKKGIKIRQFYEKKLNYFSDQW